MLRILVISLFVANLLLLGFQKGKPVAEPESKMPQAVLKDSAIPTIHLFSEMVEDQGLLTGNRQCFSLGPFHDIEDKDEVGTRLQEVTTSFSERQTEALVEKGYWVFMPPYSSLLEANEEVMSLQALGLQDISVVLSGDWKNAISLGYFLRQENALRRKKGLEDRGYAPLVRVQRQAEPRYWLEYEQSPGSALLTLDMQNRPNDFMQRAMPCPEQGLFEAAEGDSRQPVEVLAQKQIPEVVNDIDSGEDADLEVSIESTQQESAVTLPLTVGEVESKQEEEVANVIENTSQDAVETLTDAAIETGSESIGEVGIGAETNPANDIETTVQDAVETSIDPAIEAVPESMGELASSAAADPANDNETMPQEAVETLTDSAIEAVPESMGELASGAAADPENDNETTPQDAVETSIDTSIEIDPGSTDEVEAGENIDAAESILNTAQESAEAPLNKAVGTGPEWYAEPDSGEETDAVEGIENTPAENSDALLNPGIEAESETGGQTGTGEG